MSYTNRAPTEHDRYHDRMLGICLMLVWADLLLSNWAPDVFGDEKAAMLFLLPAIPVALVAISHWIAGLLPAEKCTCGKTRLIRKDPPSNSN